MPGMCFFFMKKIESGLQNFVVLRCCNGLLSVVMLGIIIGEGTSVGV